MSYLIEFTDTAKNDISFLKKTDKKSFDKLILLLKELKENPRTGLGKPKILKHKLKGLWSRRISQKHRLVYLINEDEIIVLVISAKGHYFDK